MLKYHPFLFQQALFRLVPYRFLALILGLMGWGAQRTLGASPDYFQQKVRYQIQVSLDPVHHVLHGHLRMDYTNQSPQTLDRLVMHLHPNAYSSTRTAFAQQQLAGGSTRFRFAADSLRGGMDSLEFRVNGQKLRWEFWHADTPDIATVYLEQPLLPGATVTLETPFRVRIPGDFSRMGHVGNQYQITQWYPKPAVYDSKGWHPLPYLDQGEFFSEFGTFEVDITVPAHYRVASSGDLQTPSELQWLDSLAKDCASLDSFPILSTRGDSLNPPPSSTKTLRYLLDQAHDFAWFCAPDYYVRQSKIEINGQEVKTYAFFTGRNKSWKDATLYVDSSVYYYSKWLGPYPYNTCTAVEGALRAGGGMEYPTITVISAGGAPLMLDLIIAHEVGHNWFYGILASNERDHPFMDEGFNSFYETRYLRTRYPGQNLLEAQFEKAPKVLTRILEPWPDLDNLSLLLSLRRGKDRSLWHSHTMDYDGETYGTLAYKKTALELTYLEAYLGREELDRRMQAYYQTWKFRHPSPEDMELILKQKSQEQMMLQQQTSVASKSVDWWFEERLRKAEPLDYRLIRQRIRAKSSGWELEAVLRGRGTATPLLLAITDTGGRIIRQEWVEGFEGKRTMQWNTTVLPKDLVLDPDRSLPLYVRSQNHSGGRSVWKPSLPLDFEGQRFSWLPWINYLETEGWTPGLLVMSPILLPTNLQYRGLLQVGTRSRALSGAMKVDYRWFPSQSYGPQWSASLNWRRFERLGPLNGGTLHGFLGWQAPEDLRNPGRRHRLELGWRQRYNGGPSESYGPLATTNRQDESNKFNWGRSAWAGDSAVVPTGIWPYLKGSYTDGNVLRSRGWGWLIQTGRANGWRPGSANPARIESYANMSRLLGEGRHRWRMNLRVWGGYAYGNEAYQDDREGKGGRLVNGPGLYSPAGLGGAQEWSAQDLMWARPQMVKLESITTSEQADQWRNDPAWRGLGGRQVLLRDAGFRTPAGPYSQFLLQHMTRPLEYQLAGNLELELPRSLVKLPLSLFANVQRNNWNGQSPMSPLATLADLIPNDDPWLAPLPALSWETGITLKVAPFMQFHWLAALSPDLKRNFGSGSPDAQVPWYARWSWTLDLSALDPQRIIF